MTIEIKYVRDAGNLAKERLILKATSDDEIGNYILFDTTYLENDKVSNEIRHSLWFPDGEVKENDLIVVYTKSGKDSKMENENETTSHFFYMGLGKTIWNENGDCAVLMKISSWQNKLIINDKK